jgi:hypothetical protein
MTPGRMMARIEWMLYSDQPDWPERLGYDGESRDVEATIGAGDSVTSVVAIAHLLLQAASATQALIERPLEQQDHQDNLPSAAAAQ